MDAKVISAQFTVEVNNQPSLDVLADALNFSMPTEAVQSPAAAFEATPPSSIVAAHASNAGLIALVSLLGLVYLLWRYPDNAIGSKRRTDLKGPKGLPLIGNLRWALSNKDPLAWQVEAQAKYGYGNTFTLPVLGRVIDVSRPDWIEHVQKSNFTNYAKGQAFHDQMQDVLGDGIFTMDGDNWKVQRKVASRIFSVNTFKHIITSVVREDVKLLDSIMRKHAESGEAFNLQDLFFRFTLSSFVKIAFSTDTGSLSHPDQADEFGEAFAFAQKVLDQRFVQPWWRISEKYNETGSKMRAARKVIDDFTEDIVSKRLEARKAGVEAEEGSRKDLLDLFADYRFKDGNGLNHKQLKDTILNLLIAGRDTTAEALSWMSWHMLTKPEVMDSVRSEADKFAEENGSLDIDYDDFEQHTSKLSVFHETLRLHPSIPKNIRVAAKDDVLPNGGPRIDKGDVVLYSDWAMARNPDVWGPDAATFNPRRWMSEEGTFQRFGQFKAHFFSGGPRLCLGQRLATYEVCQVVNAVFGRFDMELVDLGPKKSATFDKVPEYLNSLTHPMKRPLMVRVKGVRE